MNTLSIARTNATGTRRLSIKVLGMALSTFFVFPYVLCIAGYLLFPALPITHAALSIFLPGFALLTWPTFLLGLVESIAWGWYIAIAFGLPYNWFVIRSPALRRGAPSSVPPRP